MMRKKAKSGTKVKKAGYGKKTMKAKSGTKAKKMGYGGKAASMAPSKTKKAKAGLKTPTNPGMEALPKAVRNKIGFKKNGGKVAKKGKTVKKAGYGKMTKKAKSGCSTGRKRK